MYIQRTRQSNPYAAYNTMLEQRGVIGDRGSALRDPEPRLSQLTAPLLKQQMLAHAKRYERLGGMLSGILPTLGELGNSLQALSARLATKNQATTSLVAPAGAAAATASATSSGTGSTTTTAARTALLAGTQAITLNAGSAATTATLLSETPQLSLDTISPATAATLTLGKVVLNQSEKTSATLQGSNIVFPAKGGKGGNLSDFGSMTINGVTTTFGTFAGTDGHLAAQFIADRLNANQANTVTASVDTNSKRVTLTSKVAGSEGAIRIDGVTADSDGNTKNNISTGFQLGDFASGDDGGSDFGSVTINGVKTDFGVLRNSQQTSQTATQWMVDLLNANTANGFTASVGGADRDQITLTARDLGSQSTLTIDQVSADSDRNALNNGTNGFVAGASAQGQDADPGVTDLGSVTINGVTTEFGTLDNAGLTQQGAAQFMVERLNANSESTVVASLGGANQDQVLLTAKTPGSAGSIQVEQVSPDSDGLDDDGVSGWVAGSRAAGQDGASGLTDFGSITINGITTEFGVLGSSYTATSALQYMVDRLNQTNDTLTASAQDGKVVLSSKETGGQAMLTIDALASDSDGDTGNDRSLGFYTGQSAAGQDETTTSGGTTTGSPGAAGASGTSAAAPAGESRNTRLVSPDEVSALLGKTGQVVQSLNDYLQAIASEKRDLPKSLQSFRTELLGKLDQEEETLARLGIRRKDDRLEFDAASLEKALEQDPDSVTATFKTLQKVLDSSVGSQAFALDQMRAFATTTSESASSISQVAASIYKTEHRAKQVSWILDQMKPAEDTMREQAERLKKLEEEKKPPRGENEERKEKPKETEREKAPFGLLRSPVPDSFLQRDDASRGWAPRWHDGR